MDNSKKSLLVKKILFITLFSSFTHAKILIKELNVLVIKKNQKDQKHSILFQQKAALYQSEKEYLKCLRVSLKEKRAVLVRWDTQSLEITGCKSRKKSKHSSK